jgi:putative acetyltransferase
MSQQTPATFRVRVATAADAEAIWRVHVPSIREVCAADYTPEQIEAWAGPKRPERYVGAMGEGELFWVAETVGGGEVVGFACLWKSHLKGLYVLPAALRQGIGSALLAAVEAETARRGATQLTLHSTLTARAFYEARGFVAQAPIVRRMGEVDVPCVPMFKPFVVA